MLRIETILGSATSAEFAGRLHDLAHAGRVETIRLRASDVARRRLRAKTDYGTDIAIALPRSERLFDGAVLHCDDRCAVLIRVDETRWLPIEPHDAAAAVELGYHAGNLHWRVRFSGSTLLVGLEGPEADYLARLKGFIADGRVTIGDAIVGTEETGGVVGHGHDHAHRHSHAEEEA
jgi:urease accessory protein